MWVRDRKPFQPAQVVSRVTCWSCRNQVEISAIGDCDGYCPECDAPIDLGEEPYTSEQPVPVVAMLQPGTLTNEGDIQAGNSPVILDGSASMLRRWLAFGRGMQNAGSQLPHNLIAETESMLAAAPQSLGSEPATVPGKWIPVSERMPEEGGRYWCYVEEQNSLGKSHYQWNCSWNGDVWSDKALTGRVTHWMPLPAAPQEAINALISVVSRNEPEGK
ncbi:TPA: DUF551 domain-containing protein [Klebsiella pneumoniae]|nr:DUF551 domain-containing protein [Klebsiella pneumoniae]